MKQHEEPDPPIGSVPLFSFSVISDVHLNDETDESGCDDLKHLFYLLGQRNYLDDFNLKYICCCGDIGNNEDHEFPTFQRIVKKHCPIESDKVFSCAGNYD